MNNFTFLKSELFTQLVTNYTSSLRLKYLLNEEFIRPNQPKGQSNIFLF